MKLDRTEVLLEPETKLIRKKYQKQNLLETENITKVNRLIEELKDKIKEISQKVEQKNKKMKNKRSK